ncbi:MAG: hypothetical protein WBV18_10195 [Methyloceanibacter sp.]|jgi:hypothetical protein
MSLVWLGGVENSTFSIGKRYASALLVRLLTISLPLSGSSLAPVSLE